MGHPARLHRLTPEEYLRAERTAEVRHEYVNGEVFAISGASRRHNRIAVRLALTIERTTAGRGCETYISDVKVRVEAANAYYYPDLVVTCQPGDDDEYVVHAPTLVVEVLSPSTDQIDRREKLVHYRTIPSLREYVVIAQDEPRIEVHRRTAEGWIKEVTEDGEVTLESVGVSVSLADVYS